jgi:hypothetical protein
MKGNSQSWSLSCPVPPKRGKSEPIQPRAWPTKRLRPYLSTVFCFVFHVLFWRQGLILLLKLVSNSWAQAIPQPTKSLGPQVCAAVAWLIPPLQNHFLSHTTPSPQLQRPSYWRSFCPATLQQKTAGHAEM